MAQNTLATISYWVLHGQTPLQKYKTAVATYIIFQRRQHFHFQLKTFYTCLPFIYRTVAFWGIENANFWKRFKVQVFENVNYKNVICVQACTSSTTGLVCIHTAFFVIFRFPSQRKHTIYKSDLSKSHYDSFPQLLIL